MFVQFRRTSVLHIFTIMLQPFSSFAQLLALLLLLFPSYLGIQLRSLRPRFELRRRSIDDMAPKAAAEKKVAGGVKKDGGDCVKTKPGAASLVEMMPNIEPTSDKNVPLVMKANKRFQQIMKDYREDDSAVRYKWTKVGVSPLNRLGAPPNICLLYTSPSPRDQRGSRMPSSA